MSRAPHGKPVHMVTLTPRPLSQNHKAKKPKRSLSKDGVVKIQRTRVQSSRINPDIIEFKLRFKVPTGETATVLIGVSRQ